MINFNFQLPEQDIEIFKSMLYEGYFYLLGALACQEQNSGNVEKVNQLKAEVAHRKELFISVCKQMESAK